MTRSVFVSKMRPNCLTLAGIAITMFGTGCGGSSGNNDAAPAAPADSLPAQEAAVQESGGSTSLYCTDKLALASVTDLSGTWVAREVGSQVVSPGFVTPYRTQSVFYVVMTITQTGAAVVADGRYCDRTEIDPLDSLAPVLIPDAWAHTEKVIQRTGSFAPGSSVLDFSPKVEWAGVVPDPANLSLPTSAGASGVFDEDGDGYPGITIVLSGKSIAGSLYVVQKQTTSVLAIAVTPNRVEGVLTFESEQSVLGSDPTTLSDPNSLVGQALTKPGTSGPDPIPCNSTFVMVKVADAPGGDGGVADGGDVDGGALVDAGGGLTCAWVRANESCLFSLTGNPESCPSP